MADSDDVELAQRLVESRGDEEVVEWEPLMRGVFVLWVCAYWMSAVFSESRALRDLVNFMQHYWYWVLAVIFVGLLLCVIRRQHAFESTTPLTADQIRARLEREETGGMERAKLRFELCRRQVVQLLANAKYSCLGIFLLDRCLKTVDVVSDYLVIFCRKEWWGCPNDGLWWGEDWWWARFALFFTLNTVVVVWVVTAPIWVQQMTSTLQLSPWLSLALWGIFGIPTVLVMDFVMLARFPYWDPEYHWLTTIFILQKVVEAILEAPIQALLQGWMFLESGWIEQRLGDNIPIPWMLIISVATSAFNCLMMVADIMGQAEARELGLRECLRSLALVGLQRRPLQLHMLCWRKHVSYEREGRLSDEECRTIAKVVRHCPNLWQLVFGPENELSIEGARQLLGADVRRLVISSRDFELTYDREDRSLRLSLGPWLQAEDAKYLISSVGSLQHVEIVDHLKTERAENPIQAESLALFVYICLTLKLAFGRGQLVVSREELESLRFDVPRAAGTSPACYYGREQLLQVNLTEEVTEAILARLLGLFQYCELELVSTGPFTEELLDQIVVDLPDAGLDAEDRRFIKECSVLEAAFNARHRPQVRLAEKPLRERQYRVQDRAFYDQSVTSSAGESRHLVVYHIETGPEGTQQLEMLRNLTGLHKIKFELPHPFTAEEREQIPGFLQHLEEVEEDFVEASATLVRTVDGLQRCTASWSTLRHVDKAFKAEGVVVLDWPTKHLTVFSINAMQPQAWDSLRAIAGLRTLELHTTGDTSSDDHYALAVSAEISFLIQNLRDLISFRIPGLLHFNNGHHPIGDFDLAPVIQSFLVLKAVCSNEKETGMEVAELQGILARRCFHLEGLGYYDWSGPQHSLVIAERQGVGAEGCRRVKAMRALPMLEVMAENAVGPDGCRWIGEMRQLQSLILGSSNDVGFEGCQHLSGLGNLQILEIMDGNGVGSEGCRQIASLGKLRRLVVGGENGVLAAGCQHFRALQCLESLEIGQRNDIGHEGCRHLAALAASLLKLKIGGANGIASEGCQHLRGLRRLTDLDIGDGNEIGHRGCIHLRDLKATLQSFKLGDGNRIGETGCEYINDMHALTELRIGSDNGIGAAGCERIKNYRLERLRILVIGRRNDIGPEGCGHIAHFQRTLEQLEIGSRNRISAAGCEHLRHLTELRRLKIGGNNMVTAEGCWFLGKLCKLERLTIGMGNYLTSEGCRHLPSRLQELEIGDNNHIGYEGCAYLRQLRNLRQLEIGQENHITNRGCQYLAELQSLVKLIIRGNNRIDAAGVLFLWELPNLEDAPVVEGLDPGATLRPAMPSGAGHPAAAPPSARAEGSTPRRAYRPP